jgi:hypothetical protein
MDNDDEEDKLIEMTQHLDVPASYQIIKILEHRMWRLAEYIFTRVDFTLEQRKEVVLNLLQEKPAILKDIHVDILLKLYNWREHRLTQHLCGALVGQGLKQMAVQLQTIPFKPSPLRKVYSRGIVPGPGTISVIKILG